MKPNMGRYQDLLSQLGSVTFEPDKDENGNLKGINLYSRCFLSYGCRRTHPSPVDLLNQFYVSNPDRLKEEDLKEKAAKRKWTEFTTVSVEHIVRNSFRY